MKLTATMVGSLKADMQAELRRIERAVSDGVKAAGDGLKGSLRKQVVAAGLGARLSRTWRGKTMSTKAMTRREPGLVEGAADRVGLR